MGTKINFRNLEKIEDGGIRGEFKLNKEYLINHNGKITSLPDPGSLSDYGLKNIIDDINENQDKYKSVFVQYSSPLLEDIEEEGVADRKTVSFISSFNPYYFELINRFMKLVYS